MATKPLCTHSGHHFRLAVTHFSLHPPLDAKAQALRASRSLWHRQAQRTYALTMLVVLALGLPLMYAVLWIAQMQPLEIRVILAGAFVIGLPAFAGLHTLAVSPAYPTAARLEQAELMHHAKRAHSLATSAQ